MSSRRVSIAHSQGAYCEEPPFHPAQDYPEHRGRPIGATPNPAYHGVRCALAALGLDADHLGSRDWNPLRELVQPGDRVFIKPNWVTHEVRRSCGARTVLSAVITHASVLRAVVDYVALALAGRGEIVIGDNPSIDCDFSRLLSATRADCLTSLVRDLFGLPCSIVDLRPLVCRDLSDYGFESRMVPQPGDPRGAVEVVLGDESFFQGVSPRLLRGVFTRRASTVRAHRSGHRYSLSRSMFDADVFISVPKLKTHHKVGTTLNVKGLVGVVQRKNQLPHWRIGFPALGGDEFPPLPWRDAGLVLLRHAILEALPETWGLALKERLRPTRFGLLLHETRLFSGDFPRGAWTGNDTAWRMAADLYEAFVRSRMDQKRFFSVVDGIIGGEGDGPFCPEPKPAGVILAGQDLLATDVVATRLMGFRIEQVPYLLPLMARVGLVAREIDVRLDGRECADFFGQTPSLGFRPPKAWTSMTLDPGELG